MSESVRKHRKWWECAAKWRNRRGNILILCPEVVQGGPTNRNERNMRIGRGAAYQRLVDVKSLNIRTWFTSQEESTKAYMRAHWTNYCTIIPDKWLGPNWQEEHNHEYVNMRFWMQGRADETPKEFIQCCILYARMLLNHELGSVAEIRDVLRTAPPAWLVILNIETITRTGMLQLR
jgi:hypothetical protein